MTGHIPAWRKLGLKLKSETNENVLSIPSSTPKDLPKAKQDGTQNFKNGVKRRKLNSSAPLTTGVGSENAESTNSASSPSKRKKSVSFSQDTKLDDGDSTVTIDFPSSEMVSQAKESRSSSTKDSNEEVNGQSSKPIQKVEQKKKKTSGHQKTATQSRNSAQKSNDALDYLKQHLQDRKGWKFNKNRDTWILKNALSTENIPPVYNRALAGYLHGLPANAGARTRLVSQCRDVVKSSPTQDSDVLEDTSIDDLKLDGDTLSSEKESQFERCPRAKLLLFALNADFDSQDLLRGPSTAQTAKKKKKSRTNAVVDISSSESESESDSDSEPSSTTSSSGSTS